MDIGLDCRGFLFHQRCRCKYMPHWIRNYFRVCFCVHVHTVSKVVLHCSFSRDTVQQLPGIIFPCGRTLPQCHQARTYTNMLKRCTHSTIIIAQYPQTAYQMFVFSGPAMELLFQFDSVSQLDLWHLLHLNSYMGKNLWGVIHINSNPAGKRGWWWG